MKPALPIATSCETQSSLCEELADASDIVNAVIADESSPESATVYNLDAAISVDYYFTEFSKFTVGVRLQ